MYYKKYLIILLQVFSVFILLNLFVNTLDYLDNKYCHYSPNIFTLEFWQCCLHRIIRPNYLCYYISVLNTSIKGFLNSYVINIYSKLLTFIK